MPAAAASRRRRKEAASREAALPGRRGRPEAVEEGPTIPSSSDTVDDNTPTINPPKKFSNVFVLKKTTIFNRHVDGAEEESPVSGIYSAGTSSLGATT